MEGCDVGLCTGFCFFLIEIFIEVSVDLQAVRGNNTEISFEMETLPSLPEWKQFVKLTQHSSQGVGIAAVPCFVVFLGLYLYCTSAVQYNFIACVPSCIYHPS